MQCASSPVNALRRLRAYARRHMCAQATAGARCELGVMNRAVWTSELDRRQYRVVKLDNGVDVLLIDDSDRNGEDQPSSSEEQVEQNKSENSEKQGSKKNSEWLPPGVSDDDDEEYDPMCACAVVLKVGSFSDPQQLQGAAHYLEHMLFMGNSKFKSEGELDAFLDRHGGSCNGFTEHQYVCLHFEVDEDAFAAALDRFAHLFISPRLTQDALEREVNAVDNEFAGVLSSDVERLDRLQAVTARLDHPARNFAWGNKQSLWFDPRHAGVDVQEVVTEHCRDYCGAQNLMVVALGTHSLNKIEKMVKKTFGKVPRAPKDAPDYSSMGLPFEGNTLHVCPAVASTGRLVVTWQWSRYHRGPLEQKTTEYASALLSGQAQGSLRAALRRRGWATAVEAYCEGDGFSENDSYTLFQVVIGLTPEGLNACFDTATQGDDAITLKPLMLLFQNIVELQEHGPPQHVWEDLRTAAEMVFRFAPEPDDMSEWVAEAAESAARHSFKHCLAANYMYGDFDAPHHAEVLRRLLPSSGKSSNSGETSGCLRVDLQLPMDSMHSIGSLRRTLQAHHGAAVNYSVAADVIKGLQGSKESYEKRFGFPYVSAPLPASLVAEWANPLPAPPHLFTPPLPNPYIPHFPDSAVNTPVLRGNKESDVANWWGPSLKQPHLVLPSVVSRQRSPPNLLLEESGMRLWHLPCVYRGAPLVEIRIRLSSPAFLTFPPRVTHAFFALWRDACAAVAAAGDAAGLSLSFSNVCDHDMADLCTVEGVTMTVAGFAGSTQRFVADIFECLTQMCCNLAVLERHRMQLQQPRSLLLDNNGVKAGIDQGKGESNGTAGVTTAVSAPAIIMHGSHAIGGNAPAPCMHHEDVAEAELMEDVALRRLDAAAMEQLDEMDEFAASVLEHLLATPSHAVPTVIPAYCSQTVTSLALSTHSSFAPPSSDGAPQLSSGVDVHANNGATPPGVTGAVNEDSCATEPTIAALARVALVGIHCEALVAGNMDAEASLKLAAQVRHHVAAAAAALCPRVAQAIAASAQSSGCGSNAVESDTSDKTSNNGLAHDKKASSSNNRIRGNSNGKKRKGGKGGAKDKPAPKNAEWPTVTTPPWLPADARPLQRCVTLREGSTHTLKLNINMPGQDKSALVVYFQVGPKTPRVAALCSLLAAAMQTPAYNFLRTQEQLGYDIDVAPCTHCGVSGIKLTVSGGASAAVAATRKVEEFLEDFGQLLATMPKQEFAELKDSASMDVAMTVKDLDTDVDYTWDSISDRSYAFSAHARVLAVLRSLVVKDVRKFYQQYVAPSTDSAMSMRSRLLVQAVVRDLDHATDVDASQSLGDFSEASPRKHVDGSGTDAHDSPVADVTGRGRHRPHSGTFGRHSGCGGGGHRGGSTRGAFGEGNIWCCKDVQVSLVDTESHAATSVQSDRDSELLLASQGAVRIVDVDKWKAAQFVFPRSVGNLPR